MKSTSSRRQFLQDSVLMAAVAAAKTGVCADSATHKPEAMPMIRLGSLRVSRLILGSNPFFGFAHGNPQGSNREMREWYTDDRVMEVLDQAAELGVNAVWAPCYEKWTKLWHEYRQRGGKLQHWIAQPDYLPMEKQLAIAFENGASAVCIQGGQIDGMVRVGKWDVVRGWLELIKSHGLPAGMATHGATTHLVAEETGMPTDFYHQTMYRPDNFVPEGLEESLATIDKLKKPVVGYKVLGAGRIRPAETLPYVFGRLKPKDGLCIGVFPKKNPHEIRENAALTRELSKGPREA